MTETPAVAHTLDTDSAALENARSERMRQRQDAIDATSGAAGRNVRGRHDRRGGRVHVPLSITKRGVLIIARAGP